MTKQNNLKSLFCGILFCISLAALIIACLAFTKKGGGKEEYYEDMGVPCGGVVDGGGPCKSGHKCCPCGEGPVCQWWNPKGFGSPYCCVSEGAKCTGYIPGSGTRRQVLGTCEGGGWSSPGKCIADSDCNWCMLRNQDNSCPTWP